MLPTTMSILGIDYGDRKVGLAKAVEGSTLAVPLEVVINPGGKVLLEQLHEICQREGVTKIVVGIPVSLAGHGAGEGKPRPADYANEQMRKVLRFIERLRQALPGVEVVTQDERLSTQEAIRLSADKRQGRPEDAVAAMIILQAYLDRVGHGT